MWQGLNFKPFEPHPLNTDIYDSRHNPLNVIPLANLCGVGQARIGWNFNANTVKNQSKSGWDEPG